MSQKVNNPDKLSYVSQTTLSVDDTRDIIKALQDRFPNIIGPDVSLSNQKVRKTKDRLLNMGGIKHSYPVIKGQVMAARNGKYSGLQVIGIRKKDLANIELISDPEKKVGSIEKFANGVAIGIGVARDLNLSLGDEIRLVAPDGINTLFGITPRVSDFEVVYIFGVGRYDIDKYRLYMPLTEAQKFFNKEGKIDSLNVLVNEPYNVGNIQIKLK